MDGWRHDARGSGKANGVVGMTFTLRTKLEAMIRDGRCNGLPEKNHECDKRFGSIENCQFDHTLSREKGGDDSVDNCRALCLECHSLKTFGTPATSYGSDIHEAAKVKRLRGETRTHERAKIPSRPLAGTKASRIKLSFDGTQEKRS